VRLPTNVIFGLCVGALFLLSAYFTLSVELRRARWSSGEEATAVESGAAVEVVEVIDGDEVSVSGEHGAFIVRLQGIKAFKAASNDFEIGPIGAACVRALRSLVRGREVTVVFAEHKEDRAGRLVAYLEVDGQDVGRQLVDRGLALVYSKYPFDRERIYESAELRAKTRAEGMWGTPTARHRAEELKGRWGSERKQ